MKLVVRLLNAQGVMLGWCEHQAMALGDGLLRASGPVVLVMDITGVPSEASIHWTDINAECRVPCPPSGVIAAGTPVTLFQPKQEMVRAGAPPATRLPPVSTKMPLAIGVPMGSMGEMAGGVIQVAGA